MTHTRRNNQIDSERGWILPTVLFSVAILCSMVRLLNRESLHATRTTATLHTAMVARESLKREVKGRISTLSGCETRTFSVQHATRSVELCRDEYRPFALSADSIALPPLLIDYDQLFGSAQSCPTTPTPNRSVNSDAPTAANDCSVTTTAPHGLVVTDNIASPSLTITSSPQSTPLLATPGAITILNDLRISRDLILLGGGDVTIHHIQTESSLPIRVTVISSLGNITVGSTSGQISLLAIGRALLNVPRTEPLPPFPLPPMRPPSLRGITSVWKLQNE